MVTTTLKIQTLGRLHICCGEQPVTSLRSRKAIALLVYLTHTARTFPRMVLAELFCPNRPDDISRATLRRLLCQLNREVGQYMTITNDTASMNPKSNFWLDVVELEKTLRSCTLNGVITSFTTERIDKLERALALYQGDFLDGFYVECADFENWVMLQRERLRFLVTFALDQLIDHYILEAQYQTAMNRALRLLAMDDFREETYRHLITLSAICNQRMASLRYYDRFCSQLEEEFPGAKPSPETEDLIERIRNGAFPLPDMNCY